MTTPEDIEEAFDKAESMQTNYLRSKGWEYKCDLPGSYWLWQRKIAGRVIAVSADMAMKIQEALELH